MPPNLRQHRSVRSLITLVLSVSTLAAQTPLALSPQLPADLRPGRALLTAGHFPQAEVFFTAYLQNHPQNTPARVGLGDAQLGLCHYEAAETAYRAAAAQQPELWPAHKNLVVVEAALGRWEDFDRERTVLRLARERGAPGISARESDVIDTFALAGQRWVVRAYFEPVGRSQTLFNFEQFSPTGHVETYISLENAQAAATALQPRDVRIGTPDALSPSPTPTAGPLALNWYTASAHGNIRTYPAGPPPTYQRLRATAQRWIITHPQSPRSATP